MNGQPTDVVTPKFAFAGMESCPYFYPESSYGFTNGACASDGTRWPVERDEEPIPGVLDFWTSKPTELFPYSPVVDVQQGAPAFIAQGCGSFGRSNDVSKEDGRQYAIYLK